MLSKTHVVLMGVPTHLYSFVIRCVMMTVMCAAASIVSLPAGAIAQDDSIPPEVENQVPERTLRFSFDRAPWRSVLNWVAEESGMALFIGEVPTGTFTYSDPNLFTPEETIDRINLFLIPEGYTFVRSGRLLSLITLGDPRSLKQLDAMSTLVSVEELEDRGTYEIVKCIFPLTKTDSSTAMSELNSLGLITQPVVLAGSNQLILTDTAGKLRTAKRILASLESRDRGSELVKSFVLQHVTADEILNIARPHLGIEADQMAGFDVSLSTDNKGNKLFATGSKESIELLESLVSVVDRAEGEKVENRILQSHAVSGENLRAVYDVLLTLLADQPIRMSEDDNTNSIVALAPPEIHKHIRATIAELDGPGQQFAIIELKTLNPYAAMTLLNELFGAVAEEEEDEYEWWDWRRRYRDNDDDDDDVQDVPKIHADLQRKRLLVRGTPAQIKEIEDVIARLDTSPRQLQNVRILPSLGTESDDVLRMARDLWRGKNPILLTPPSGGPSTSRERTIHSDDSSRTEPGQQAPPGSSTGIQTTTGRGATLNAQLTRNSPLDGEQADPIQIRLSPQGIMLESDDTAALEEFEEHLRQVARLGGATDSAEPIIFYLKYATADEATKMLADLLDGARWLSSSSGGFLSGGGELGTDDSYYGSLLMNRDGLTTMTAGAATVVSDARLNRLIVQGTAEDIALIESYLRVIDKDSSITTIETRGRSQVIELFHTQAAEVAGVIREAYGARIANSTQQQQNRQQRDRRSEDDEDRRNRDDDDDERRRPNGRAPRNREAEMTLAVHEASNSLVVTAPKPLFTEVERLARLLDKRAEQSMRIVIPKTMSGRHVEAILYNALRQPGTEARELESHRERSREGGRRGRERDDEDR